MSLLDKMWGPSSRKSTQRRNDEHGNTYLLSDDLAAQFDAADDRINDDDEFWRWFSDFRDTHGLTPSNRRSSVVASDFWGGTTSWTPTNYSDLWGASKLFGSAGNDDDRRLAIGLQAVRTTVRVVDNSARPMSVRFASDLSSLSSYTSFDDRSIQVSPAALLDRNIDQMQGIDITTGWALHEASHAAYTESTLSALEIPTRLTPLSVTGMLLNVLEDLRIERLTSDKFPGFATYFDQGNDYLWQRQAAHVPTAWGPELNDKVNAIILAAKWHAQFQPLADASGDADLAAHAQWFYDWGQRYINGTDTARSLLEQALDRLNLDPTTQQQLADQSASEQQAQLDLESIREAVKHAIDKMRNGDGGIDSCPSPVHAADTGGAVTKSTPTADFLPHERATEVERLAVELYAEHSLSNVRFPVGDVAPDHIVTMRPSESISSRDFFDNNRPEPQFVSRMRSAFFFRPSAMQWSSRNLRTGTLDDDELWRAGAGDPKFFEQRVVESTPDTNVTLLVDVSGSMSTPKLRSAFQAAYTMWSVLRDMNGVRVRVRAHTACNGDIADGSAIIYDIWQTGEPVSRLGTLGTVSRGNNFDGYAIGWCAAELMSSSHPGEQNVLFVIADGLPNSSNGAGRHYGDSAARDHVRSVVEHARRNGVDTISVAIDSDLRESDQSHMFRNWIPFTDLGQLSQSITQTLKRLF